MAITGSGYDYSVGGAQGTGFTGGSLPYLSAYATEGVSVEKWLSWSTSTQTKWLQEFNRTEAQQNYTTDSPQAYAYGYTQWIDTYTDPTTYTEPVKDYFTPDKVFVILAGALLYLTRGR